MTATYFRIYDLPWTPSETEERRFRRVVGAAVGLFVAFGIIVPFLPAPPRPLVAPAIPERIVEFLIEQPRPKPPPKVESPRRRCSGAGPRGGADPEGGSGSARQGCLERPPRIVA